MTTTSQPTRSVPVERPGVDLLAGWWLQVVLHALAAVLTSTVLLGPLVVDLLDYRVSHLLRSQLIGADAVSGLVAVPLLLYGGWLCRHGRPAGPLLLLAPASYTAYLTVEAVLSADPTRPGNQERYFPLLLVQLLLALAVAVLAWRAADPSRLAALPTRRRHLLGSSLLVLAAALVLGRYLPTLADVMSAHPTDADYLAGPTVFWTVALEDLGFCIPALIVAGIATLRSRGPAVPVLAYAGAGWLLLIGLAVLAMATSSLLAGDSGVGFADLAVLGTLATCSAVPATLLAGMFRHRRT
jgi:hypothetical protein